MPRILLFSDLHSDEHDDFSYKLPNGMNSRLVDCLDVIDKVNRYRREYDCNVVCFCGDLFHTPSSLSTVVFQETFKRLEKLAKDSDNLILMAGNHDMAKLSKDNPVSTVYATRRLKNTKTVVAKYRGIDVDDTRIHCVPYIRDKKELEENIGLVGEGINSLGKKRRHIIITHIGLDQAVNGPNEIKLKHEYAVSKLKALKSDYIFSGHHHHPQTLGPNHVVIGSPIQLNMLDRGDRRGILIYDTERKDTVSIWLAGSKFYLYEIKDLKDFDKMQAEQQKFRGGYVRVMLTKGVVSESKVNDVVSASAKMYKILPVRNPKSTARSTVVTNRAISNVGNLSAVVDDYVTHINPPGLKPKRLITVGKRLITRK